METKTIILIVVSAIVVLLFAKPTYQLAQRWMAAIRRYSKKREAARYLKHQSKHFKQVIHGTSVRYQENIWHDMLRARAVPENDEEARVLQAKMDWNLHHRWNLFAACASSQESGRQRYAQERKQAAAAYTDEGRMTADTLRYRLYVDQETARAVASTKQDFWKLHEAARLLGFKTFPEGSYYAALPNNINAYR